MTHTTKDDVQRTMAEFADGEWGRIYYDRYENIYASVTTVLGQRDDSQKDYALQKWRENNDGNEGRPFHEHIKQYSQWRGTLAHWYIQQFIDPNLEAGPEEQEAVTAIELNNKNYDFVRSIALNHSAGRYTATEDEFPSKVEWLNQANDASQDDPVTLEDIVWDDITWATQNVTQAFKLLGLAEYSVYSSPFTLLPEYFDMCFDRDAVYLVEEFLVNSEDRYAGQCDLLCETNKGTTLIDFKTSKSVYWSYPRQLAAYAKAIEDSPQYDIDFVDEVVVCRTQPDHHDLSLAYEDDLVKGDSTRYDWHDEFMDLNDAVQALTEDIDLRNLDDVDNAWLATPVEKQTTVEEYAT